MGESDEKKVSAELAHTKIGGELSLDERVALALSVGEECITEEGNG